MQQDSFILTETEKWAELGASYNISLWNGMGIKRI